jgi:predicted transcriptional regulator
MSAQVETTLEQTTPYSSEPTQSMPLKGIKAELGTLERPIMNIIWSLDKPVEVGEVVIALRNHPDPTMRREVAYTTVMTTMTRMAQKKYLVQDRSGVPYRYTPAISRDQFRVEKVWKTINELRQTDPEGVAMAIMGMMSKASENTAVSSDAA